MGVIHIGIESSGAPADDWKAHLQPDKKQTYFFFIGLLRAAMLVIAFTLTALVSFAFGHILPVVLGFLVLLIGTLAVIIDLVRHSHFGLSLTVLVLAMLAVAVSVG